MGWDGVGRWCGGYHSGAGGERTFLHQRNIKVAEKRMGGWVGDRGRWGGMGGWVGYVGWVGGGGEGDVGG